MKHYMPTNGIYAYCRMNDAGDQAVVLLNGQNNPLSADMSRYSEILTPGASYTDILTGETVIPMPADGKPYDFKTREVRVLVPAR